VKAGAAWSSPEGLICSGAYKPQIEDDTFFLVPNPHAAQGLEGAVGFERVEFLPAFSADAAQALVIDGRAHLQWAFTPDAGAAQGASGTAARLLKAEATQSLLYVAANGRRKLTGQRELRHGLAMTIDREKLISTLKLGSRPIAAVPAYGLVPPVAQAGYNAQSAPYAGLSASDRGLIGPALLGAVAIDRNHPVTLELCYAAGRLNGAIAKTLQSQWGGLGVKLTLQERSAADHEQALLSGSYDLALCAASRLGASPEPYLAPFAAAAGDNITGYAEKSFDRALVSADGRDDAILWSSALSSAEATLAEDQVVFPVFFFTPATAVADLAGWQANKRAVHPLRALKPV
jgi:ABC-type oligopeptide transport system substrate-binding subunit